jgi:hypothetical protein
MHDKNAQDPLKRVGSPTDRLLRDLIAIELLDANRLTAAERLSDKLGDDLVAAIRAELNRLNSSGSSLDSLPGDVA